MSTHLMDKNNMDKNDKLEDAFNAVKNGMSAYSASRKYGVSKTTLLRRLRTNDPASKTSGPPTILSKEQELHLCTWITHMSKIGFSITKNMLLDSVQMLVRDLKLPNNFKDDRPGRHWFENFFKRNPSVTQRVSQNLVKNRAKVTENRIREWFNEIYGFLENKKLLHIFQDPNRIFNCDETAFFLSPKEKCVLAKRGQKTVYSFVSNDEKECITTLIMGNANGTVAPSMVIYKYQRIPATIAFTMPKGWGIGRSESGWMTGETFFEYISNVFYPWLLERKIEFPVVLFADGHTSHLTLHLSKFCQEKDIILIALPPNATHIMQPLDVAFFHPLKAAWKLAVQSWRIEKSGQPIRRENFAPLLNTVLQKKEMEQNLKSGFKATGLYPFDPDVIKYEQLFNATANLTTSTPIHGLNKNEIMPGNLKFLEREIGEEKILEFKKQLEKSCWDGPKEDQNLFYLWKKVHLVINCSKSQPENKIEEDQNLSMGDTTFKNNAVDDTDIFLSDVLTNILNDDDHDDSKHSQQPNEINQQEKTPVLSEPSPFKEVITAVNNIPTPFKRNLFWPEPKLDNNSRKRVQIPAVASSEQWIEFHEKKRKQKEEKHKNTLIKRKLREERKNNNVTKKVKNIINDADNVLRVQQYIVVKYEEEFFPGIVLEKKEKEVFVKVLCMCGKNWKWPEKDDLLWYKFTDVVTKIEEPKLINARGVYYIKEMENIKNFKKIEWQ